jgi:large subunit ribosomal protein L6
MEKIIPISEGVVVKKEGKELVLTKDGKENRKEVFHPMINISVKDDNIVLSTKKDNRSLKKIFNSFVSHINNLLSGLQEPFVYKLKICGSHFPITVKVEGKDIYISNYLGEKKPRKCKIVGDANVKVQGDIIIVESTNKEHAGMTAGIIEKTSQVRMHDRRVFQDGIYIIEKVGKKV